MSEVVRCGLIQLSNPINDESVPVAEIQEAMFQKHIPYIEEAGEKGVDPMSQEIFNGPYFCPSQDTRWYDAAEPVPGPTTERMAAYAKNTAWSSWFRCMKRRCELFYNTYSHRCGRDISWKVSATYSQVTDFGKNFSRQAMVDTLSSKCHDWCVHLLRPPLPRGRTVSGSEWRGDCLQSKRNGCGIVSISLEDGAACARGRERLLRGCN